MGVGSQNTFLTYDPYPIARLCCEFQLSKGKTVGGDALQRPKSASKIYLSMDLDIRRNENKAPCWLVLFISRESTRSNETASYRC